MPTTLADRKALIQPFSVPMAHWVSISQLLSYLARFILGACLAGVLAPLFWTPSAHGQSFHPHVVTSTASTVQAASGADVDGDGDTDVIAAAFGDDELVWYENQEGASFAKHTITGSVDGPYCIHVTDLNGDKYPDVFVGTLHGDKIKWFKNDRDGSFTGTTIDKSAGAPYSLHVATIDDDKHPDLLSAANETDQIVWYQNQGDNTFSSAKVLSSSADGASSVFAADLDRNDRTDVLAASRDENTVSWIRNEQSGFSEVVIREDIGGAASVYAADVTGNDATDVISAGVAGDKIILHENTTADADSVTFRKRVLSSGAEAAESVVAADIGEDGDVDIVSASRGDDTVRLYENNGRARLSERVVTDSASGAIHVAAADMDGDGNTDILVSSQGDNSVQWFETNLRPSARDTSIELTEDEVLSTPAPGALVNDEDPDGDSLTAAFLSAPKSGLVPNLEADGSITVKTNGNFDYLSEGETETKSLTYAARDEHGLADTASVKVTIHGVNDRPTARPNTDSTIVGDRVVTDVLANDEDIDGQVVASSLSLATLPDHGSVRSEGVEGIAYTPESGFAGRDRYKYVVSDGHGGTDTSRVDITVRPSAPTITRAEGGNRSAYLKWSVNDSIDVQSYRVYRSSVSTSGQGSPDTVTTNSATAEYEQKDLTNRRVFNFLVTAVVSGPIEGVPDTVRVVPRPPDLDLDGTVSFGYPDQTNGYRMVGLPGAPKSLSLTSTLSGDAGEAWTAFAASGITESEEIVSFQENPGAFGFDTGRGFWVLSESSWKPSGKVSTTSVDDSTKTAISLPSGWSVITNPFPEAVSWLRVLQATPGLKSELWAFDGQFSAATTLVPYEGYYVFNDPARPIDTLRIPYPIKNDSASANARSAIERRVGQTRKPKNNASKGKQGLEIRARIVGEMRGADKYKGSAHLRVGAGTSVGRDSVDQFAPPAIGVESFRLTVHSEEASNSYPVLRTEGRPLGSDQVATFRLRLSGPREVRVAVSGDDFSDIAGASVFLYDPATRQVTNLRKEEATVHLTAGVGGEGSDRHLEVWIGDPEALNDRRGAVRPKELTLHPPAPNPMSASTRLRYSIPQSKAPVRARIVVYDVLGRTVQRLVSDQRKAGQHVIQWNGEDAAGQSLASGIYFCRFIVDGKPVETRKITIVR